MVAEDRREARRVHGASCKRVRLGLWLAILGAVLFAVTDLRCMDQVVELWLRS